VPLDEGAVHPAPDPTPADAPDGPAEAGEAAGSAAASSPGIRAAPVDPDEEPGRLGRALLFLLVAIPVTVNAIVLLPELIIGAPSLNDDAFQYLMLHGVSQQLSMGGSLLDFWQPQLELGFPQFLYYQHLPHLATLVLDRALLGTVDLLTVFDLVRYLLLVGLPITVFWSMRRMGFSLVAAAVAAAASSLLAADARYGFEYDSYVWRGLGMFTQLWAMHLSFISLACVYRVLQRGNGYIPAILALSALVLSHLVYAYMMAITLVVVLLVGSRVRTFAPRVVRLGVVGILVLAATSYMWLPFVTMSEYLGASPYLQEWKYDSFGAQAILGWLFSGDLLDHGRLPVLTVLLGMGVVGAILARTRLAALALVGFLVWLVLYFGRPTLGPIADLFPFKDGLLFHRFIGAVDLFAILLMGIGGAWVWRLFARIRTPWYPVVGFAAFLLLLAPAMAERVGYYADNSRWMQQTKTALDADTDLRAVVDTLATKPGGRTYAGLRSNWGAQMTVGPYVHVYDILTFYAIPAVSPPYQSLSLNADMIWDFRDGEEAQYDLLDVRYVIVPSSFTVPAFYQVLKQTPTYTLYSVPTTGAAYHVSVVERREAATQLDLFTGNIAWYRSTDPAERRFIRWDYKQPPGLLVPTNGCPDGGKTDLEIDEPGSLQVVVTCPQASTLALKMTYHPNWHVTVDGVAVDTFMVSPSYIGLDLPAGTHQVTAVYEPTPSKGPLLLLGVVALVAAFFLRRRLDLPAVWVERRRWRSRPKADEPA
jgi:MYXO-CTERM domain-containing protein